MLAHIICGCFFKWHTAIPYRTICSTKYDSELNIGVYHIYYRNYSSNCITIQFYSCIELTEPILSTASSSGYILTIFYWSIISSLFIVTSVIFHPVYLARPFFDCCHLFSNNIHICRQMTEWFVHNELRIYHSL